MTAGPLSYPAKNKEKAIGLDSAEKRDGQSAIFTGKTEQVKHHKPASMEQMKEQARKGNSKNLGARLAFFERAGDKTPTKFHRPGSNKK